MKTFGTLWLQVWKRKHRGYVCTFTLPCPSEKFDEFSIFMQKANFTMNLGAWVMDRGDGEVRFRVGFDVGAYELTQLYLRKLTIYTNMTMETYLPGIRALIKDGKSAREAYGIVFPGR